MEEVTAKIVELEGKVEEQKLTIDELEKRREAAKKEIKLLHAKLNKKAPAKLEEERKTE